MTMAGYRIMRLLIVVGVLFQGCDSDVKCRNDKGTEVDWYILYKLPKIEDDGLSYMYMDESTSGWKLSREKINSKSGTLANTLKPLLDFYDKKTVGFEYMLYNDQPPDPYVAPASFGHSKGVVMLDKGSGVWLSHSTPKFPTYRKKDFWPTSGNPNAQTFMCVTYPYSEFKKIGLQLKYIHAYSYDSDLPTTFYEELRCVAQRDCYPKVKPWFSVMDLNSMEGRPFSSFAKYTRFGDGVLLFNRSQGFWLSHSIPHFPSFPEKGYLYPSSGKVNGQTALCVTYQYEQFLLIAKQMAYLYPRFYNCSVPAAFLADMPQLAQLCKGTKPPFASDKAVEQLFSIQGEKFVNFVKSERFVDDIYTGWVAQALGADLLVETWQTQGHELPSNCSLPKHTLNIKRIRLPGSILFQSHHDHSKWCVSRIYEEQVTCLGDLNRERAQMWRGGGLVCSFNPLIYKAFRQVVDWYIGC